MVALSRLVRRRGLCYGAVVTEPRMASTFPYLIELVEQGTAGLPGVARKRMFGCDVFFRGGTIFALLWKTGRIGVKLPDPRAFAELMAMPGAEPWEFAGKTMSRWVLVPEELHDDPDELAPWLRRAHALAGADAPARRPARRPAVKRA